MSTITAHESPMSHVGHYDVAVIGGGPAGAAVAIALRHAGLSAAIFEASQAKGMRFGETLPGRVIRPLSQLGVWEPFRDSCPEAAPVISFIWGSEDPYESSSIWDPYGSGWHVDRIKFDCMLGEAAKQSGAAIYYGARVQSCKLDASSRWTVRTRARERWFVLTADTLIDATGRASWLARYLGIQRRIYDRLMAIVAFGENPDSGRSRTVVESCPDGWWYCATLPHGRSVAALFTDSDLIKRDSLQRWYSWSERCGRTRLASAFLPGFDPSNPLRVVSAATATLDRTVGVGWLAVGDAACSIDPLSGQGVTMALDSALAAAVAIVARSDGEADAFENYHSASCLRFQQSRIRAAEFYSHESRWRNSLFWNRRHARSGGTTAITEASLLG